MIKLIVSICLLQEPTVCYEEMISLYQSPTYCNSGAGMLEVARWAELNEDRFIIKGWHCGR